MPFKNPLVHKKYMKKYNKTHTNLKQTKTHEERQLYQKIHSKKAEIRRKTNTKSAWKFFQGKLQWLALIIIVNSDTVKSSLGLWFLLPNNPGLILAVYMISLGCLAVRFKWK